VDDDVSRQALRLALGAELTRRAARCAGARIAPDAGVEDLRVLAARLAEIAPPVERAHRLRFDPPFPGATGGVEELRAGRRLVFACTARPAAGGDPAAVVITTLIAGRAPLVSAAPPGAPIPPHWRPLATT